MNFTITSYLKALADRTHTAASIISDYFYIAQSLNPKYNACLRFYEPSSEEIVNSEQKPLV